jgi:hypothetical protein
MPKWKSIRTLALLGLVVLAGAACTDDRKPTPGTSGNAVPSASSSSSSSSSESPALGPVLAVTSAQPATGSYSFDTAGVERLTAGDVTFSFTNSDTDRHEARLIRILDGNVSAYRAALSANGVVGVSALGAEAAALGPNDPGKTSTTTVLLGAGTYVIVDFLPTSDGTVFAQHGLLRELLVVAG